MFKGGKISNKRHLEYREEEIHIPQGAVLIPEPASRVINVPFWLCAQTFVFISKEHIAISMAFPPHILALTEWG